MGRSVSLATSCQELVAEEPALGGDADEHGGPGVADHVQHGDPVPGIVQRPAGHGGAALGEGPLRRLEGGVVLHQEALQVDGEDARPGLLVGEALLGQHAARMFMADAGAGLAHAHDEEALVLEAAAS